MDKLRKAALCCRHNYQKWLSSPRMLALALLIWLAMDASVGELANFARRQDLMITALGVYPLLSSNLFIKLLINMGGLMLFCNAPFVDEMQPYLILRCGRGAWTIGQLMYIISGVLLYLIMLNGVAWLYLGGRGIFNNEWSNGLRTLMYLEGMEGSPLFFSVDPKLVLYFTPLNAWLMSMALDFMGLILVAGTTFIVNQAFSSNKGVIAAGILLLTDPVVAESSYPLLWFWSPMTLTRITNLDMGYLPTKPDIQYAFILLPVLCGITMAVAFWAGRYKSIEVRPDLG